MQVNAACFYLYIKGINPSYIMADSFYCLLFLNRKTVVYFFRFYAFYKLSLLFVEKYEKIRIKFVLVKTKGGL